MSKPSTGESTRSKTQIQSVSRAARILLYVAEQPEPPTAKQVSNDFGFPLPTTYHLLNTLVAEGLLTKDSGRRFRVGAHVGLLSDAFHRELSVPEYLLLPLRELAERTGETTYVSGWRGGEIVVLASMEGRQAVRVSGLYSGFSGHAHARASGKLLLALAGSERRSVYLDCHPLERATENTIVDHAELDKEFKRIRRRGYSTDEEEFRAGVAGISAPVRRGDSPIAALTVSPPIERFRKNRGELVAAVLETTETASSYR
jgi:IclR family acetate operon transcriptional repressor